MNDRIKGLEYVMTSESLWQASRKWKEQCYVKISINLEGCLKTSPFSP